MSVELVICPLCCAEIHRHVAGQVETRLRVPSTARSFDLGTAIAMLAEVNRVEREDELAACERACTEHYEVDHRQRLWLWRRLGWTWLMRWPTREPARMLRLDQTSFDPMQFISKGETG